MRRDEFLAGPVEALTETARCCRNRCCVISGWAVEEGKLAEQHCQTLRRLYEVDRSDIIWTPADRAAFDAVVPNGCVASSAPHAKPDCAPPILSG